MDPDTEVDVDMSPYLIRYKSGRVRRLMGTSKVAAGTDAATGVTSKDVVVDATFGLAARLYIPSDALTTSGARLPILVYFHGGAFSIHSAFSATHSRFLNALVSASRAVAHPLPAAYDDAWAALRWAVSRTEEPWLSAHADVARLFVAGDSAGANMAHQVTLRLGGLPGGARIERIALLHPYFRGKELVPSEGTDPRSSDRQWAFVCAGRYGMDHPFVNPLAMTAAEWASLGCRRVLVAVAELDTMSERGRRYVEALRGSAWAGEEAVLYVTQGEGHVFFLRNFKESDRAMQDMITAVASFLASSTAGGWLSPSVRSLGCPQLLMLSFRSSSSINEVNWSVFCLHFQASLSGGFMDTIT
ncbi:hypothetical protein HU200_061593 [Digitaria exilis]|uniref:Alpha/beta hydrolase fold-3 domain-containing protein n=1 Tax=Digitaria exilis TaxID=1010633 RepID=A0A835DWD9_9POAL|nr:hypothetical protein HU200_061593 [Digitaria exilis]